MLTMTFPEAADRVKSALDIVDIVQRHVILKKSGRNFSGLCPLHNDKNPSMNISREKNLFKCFSCGAGGDALAFLMRIENKTYGEVIQNLAQEQGITIINDGQDAQQAAAKAEQTRSEKQTILALNTRTQQWFHNQLINLPEAIPVRDYLTNRQIDEQAIFKFGIGYAPSGWENLVTYLKNNESIVKENPDILLTAGLASQKQSEQHPNATGYYDRFRHRLMIPIHDERGDIVAFGGRALSSDEKAKYLNSPETSVYHKSRVLYGLHWAKESIRTSKIAVVMEGYFDVISAHLAGITQTVGSCGTALSEQHIKLLIRFGTETLYLAFDSDEAGQKAALSAIHLMEPYLAYHKGLSVKILALPDNSPYKDPDEFIRAEGAEAFAALFNNAKPFLDFKFDYALKNLDAKTPQGRVEAAQRITPMLSTITQPILRMEMLARYAERIGVSQEALSMEVRQHEQRFSQSTQRHLRQFAPGYNNPQRKTWQNGAGNTFRKQQKPTLSDNVSELRSTLLPRHVVAERNLLRLVLIHPEAPQHLLPLLETRTLQNPICQHILTVMIQTLDEYELDELTTHELIADVSAQLNERQLEALSLFAELVLTAEQYPQALKLTDSMPKSTWLERILNEAQQLLNQLDEHQQQQTLKHILSEPMAVQANASVPADSASDPELQEIEKQYQLYQELKQRRSRQHSNQPTVL